MRNRLLATAVTAALTALVAAPTAAAAPIGAYTTKGAWNFVSAPSLHPPQLRTDAPTVLGKLAPGSFLVDNFPNVGARGPMTGEGGPLILDSRLRPVWFRGVGSRLVSGDLQQQTYNGQPVLLWWQGVITRTGATQTGQVVVVDQHYRQVATLRAQAPWQISVHDAQISGGNIWVTVYRYVHGQNLSAYGGRRNGTVYDSGVQEYDLGTGRLLYTWDALNPGGTPNIPLSASEQPASVATAPGGAWDAYHVNSIKLLANDQILVSLRNTWAAYLIDTGTGKTVWTLGGKRSSFSMPNSARFSWQHDVEMLPSGDITLYDDACCKELPGGKFAKPSGQSRGLVLRPDMTAHSVSVVASYPHHPPRVSAFLGSMSVLPGGNVLVGWGSVPFFSEYSGSGRLLLDAAWPGKDQSYRALFSSSWVGTPYYPPSGAVSVSHGASTVYASWNGATEVAKWELLGGSSAARLQRVAVKPRAGFETAISLGSRTYKVLQVRALDAAGNVLGTTKLIS
jgi:Arylsulfotransferase (ASST)